MYVSKYLTQVLRLRPDVLVLPTPTPTPTPCPSFFCKPPALRHDWLDGKDEGESRQQQTESREGTRMPIIMRACVVRQLLTQGLGNSVNAHTRTIKANC